MSWLSGSGSTVRPSPTTFIAKGPRCEGKAWTTVRSLRLPGSTSRAGHWRASLGATELMLRLYGLHFGHKAFRMRDTHGRER